MLYLLFTIIVIIPVLSGIGTVSEKIFGALLSGISGTCFSGIFAISVVWLVLAFFFPLNIYVEIITLILGLSAFFYFRKYDDFYIFFKDNYRLFVPFCLVTVFAGAFYPFILDHFGYYIPSIRWLSEFGLTKGIANLEITLGQMSFWHIFQAGFSHFSDSFFRINTVLLIVYLVYIFERKSWLHLCFLPIFYLFSQSPSPDLPVLVFSLVLLNELFSGKEIQPLWFVFSVFVFCIKPTMLWLPMFSFFVLMMYGDGKKWLSVFLGIAVLLLFFIKNIWTFGYPIFPVQVLDFSLAWKPNPEFLEMSSQVAIQKTYDMQYTIAEINGFSVVDTVYNWLFLDGVKSFIHISFVVFLLVFTGFVIFKKDKKLTILYISILFKSLLVLLFSAQYRFFIDVFFVIFFVMFYKGFAQKKAIAAFAVLGVLVLSCLSFPEFLKKQIPSFRVGSFMMGFSAKQFYKPSYFLLNQYKTHKIGNLEFNVATGYPFSFDVPQPAISKGFIEENYEVGIFPQKVGERLEDGLIWKPLSEEDKQKLQRILSETKTSEKDFR